MYTTKQDIENYLLTTIDASFESQVESWISMAQKYIENYTDRIFEKSSGTKKYDGNGRNKLFVYDLLSVDSVKFVSTNGTEMELADTDYVLDNFHDSDPEKLPFNQITINPYGSFRLFPDGMRNIHIEGDWGFSEEVPGDIRMVATKLVASIIKAGKDGNVKSFTQADYSVTYDTFANILNSDLSVKGILDFYKRPQKLTGFTVSRV